MLAAHAIVNNPVLVYSDSAINSRHKVLMAMLTKPFLERRRQLDFVLHCNSSCHLDIFVSKVAVFLENFLCMLEKKIDAIFCNF